MDRLSYSSDVAMMLLLSDELADVSNARDTDERMFFEYLLQCVWLFITHRLDDVYREQDQRRLRTVSRINGCLVCCTL